MMELIEELENLSLKEILGYVIESEEKAKEYYTELSKNAPELVAVKFENLAKEEEMHKKTVLALYRERFGNELYKIPENLPPLESPTKVKTITSLIGALEKALWNEHNAYRVYTFLAAKEKDHRDLFTYLATMEKGHYEVLRMEKDTYESHVIEAPHVKGMTLKDLWVEAYRTH